MFVGLIVADVAIGLTYILLARGLAEDYSFGQRVQEVIYGLVGVSGPVQWAPETRGDLFNLLTSALGIFTAAGHRVPVPAARPSRAPGWAAPTPTGSGNCSASRATGTRSATSRCAATRA